ncbi:hypothetical protein V1264_002644 [Littorina saxatilis]
MALCILLLKKRVHYLPVITAVFIIASFFISYGVSVGHGHVEADFPYISHTAVKAPERCIFAQLINIGAFLLAANVYVRYLQQTEMFKEHVHPFVDCCAKDRRLMIASLVIGWLSALGLSMVANFQTIEMRPPHYVGAGMAFGLGLVYCWIQTSISLRHPPIDCVTVLQLLNSIILSICLVTFGVSKTIFKVKEGRGEGTKHDELRPVYLVSTISEWLTAAAVVLFLLTFYPSFSKITITGPRIVLQRSRPYSTANGNTHTTSMSNNGTLTV